MRPIALLTAIVLFGVAVALAQPRPNQPPAQLPAPAAQRGAPPAAPRQGAVPQPQRGVMPPAAAQPATGRAASEPRAADDAAIRQVIDAVVRAYNAHDAKALAALFLEEGEIVDEQGDVFQGRAAIGELFAEVFATYPGAKMDIDVERIRFLAPTLAVEEGATAITHDPSRPAEVTLYSVTYLKQDGRWQVASARDIADVQLRGANELEQLGWLIGEWVDESDDALVKTTYAWDENHRYILGDFAMHISGRPALTGSQRIGWDPLAKQVHSWVFDSAGGFGQGIWNQDGDNTWIVKFTGVTADGEVGSATNYYRRLSPDAFAYESHDRMVGGEPDEDTPAITVVRVPPKPGE